MLRASQRSVLHGEHPARGAAPHREQVGPADDMRLECLVLHHESHLPGVGPNGGKRVQVRVLE